MSTGLAATTAGPTAASRFSMTRDPPPHVVLTRRACRPSHPGSKRLHQARGAEAKGQTLYVKSTQRGQVPGHHPGGKLDKKRCRISRAAAKAPGVRGLTRGAERGAGPAARRRRTAARGSDLLQVRPPVPPAGDFKPASLLPVTCQYSFLVRSCAFKITLN